MDIIFQGYFSGHVDDRSIMWHHLFHVWFLQISWVCHYLGCLFLHTNIQLACFFHTSSFPVKIVSFLAMFGIVCTCCKNTKKSWQNGENSCDRGHPWIMMPNINKHKITGKYCSKCECEKFQKSAKMLIKCRKFSWARWYRTHDTK